MDRNIWWNRHHVHAHWPADANGRSNTRIVAQWCMCNMLNVCALTEKKILLKKYFNTNIHTREKKEEREREKNQHKNEWQKRMGRNNNWELKKEEINEDITKETEKERKKERSN